MKGSFEEKPMDLGRDLEFWMTNLPQKLRTIPIIHLAIPGSHDSFTSSITKDSDMSPDAEPILQHLKFLGPILKYFMANWSRTQDFLVADQLKNGTRYFDLRIATKVDRFFFVHGLYSIDVLSVLNEIDLFLQNHSQEFVILDCQHFYAFTQDDHDRLMLILAHIFGHKLMPYSPHMEHLSLEYMTTQCGYQVIVVYRSDAARFGQPLLWPSASFPTPWPDTDSIPELIQALDDGLANRDDTLGYVTQCVLTPSSWFVIRNLFSTLKEKCAIEFADAQFKWLAGLAPGKGGVNIVISDFVDLNDCQYPKEIINLNNKLLNDVVRSDMAVIAITPVDTK